MWTADKFLDYIEKGRVITRKDLHHIIVEIRESEYERGCEAMRKIYSDIAKKRKENRIKKNEKEYNKISSEISDYAYRKRQEGYYGEEEVDEFGKRKENGQRNLKRKSNKRVRTIPEEVQSSGEGEAD